MKAVFDTKSGSHYDDEVAVRYHFPNGPYLSVARACIGDWIVYREPRDHGGSMAYFGVARVGDVVGDAQDPSHSYALISDYLPFDLKVPFQTDGIYEEEILRTLPNRAGIGLRLRGRSVRKLGDEDFASIVLKGLGPTLSPENAARLGLDHSIVRQTLNGFQRENPSERARRVAQLLVNRTIRDASFRHRVLRAYDDTCAVTGLRIVNGGGRAEAQAAHILPVAAGGPDIEQNGIALCGTAHWLFDRHLITIGANWELLIAHNRLPERIRSTFFSQIGQLHLPTNKRLWPGSKFLDYHRERFLEATSR